MSQDDLFASESSGLIAGQQHQDGELRQRGGGRFVPPSDLAAPDKIDDDTDLVRALFAEFLGSFFLVLLVLAAVYGSAFVTSDTTSAARALLIALTYGFTMAAAVYAFSFPSADRRRVPNVRHLNPAVTFALVAAFKIHVFRAVLYLMAQVCGAGVAVLAIFYATPYEKRDVLSAYPIAEGVSVPNTWITEIVISFVVCLTILMVQFGFLGGRQPSIAQATQEASPMTFHETNATAVGLVVFSCSLAANAVSGGHANPLMAIGIAILSGKEVVAAFVAPLIGATIAVLVSFAFGFRSKFMYFNEKDK